MVTVHTQNDVPKASWWSRLWSFGRADEAGANEVVFPPGFLESIERLRVLAVRAGGGLKDGHRLGAYRGGQLEFHDYRNYVAGDDLRYVDWNLYARLGKAYVKEFAREEAGHLYLLIDGTASMRLGAPSKFTSARRVAAMLAHIAWSSHDHVRVFVYTDGPRLNDYPARGARGHTPGLLEWLRRQPPAPPWQSGEDETHTTAETVPVQGDARTRPGQGRFLSAVRSFLRTAPARGRVFLLGDFWHEEREISEAVGLMSGAGFDLAALQFLAHEEVHPSVAGPLRVFGLEEPGEVELNATEAARTAYTEELEAHLAAVESIFKRRGGQYLLSAGDGPLEKVLLQSLRRRRWLS